MRTGLRHKGIAAAVSTAVLVLLLVAGIMLSAGCQSEQQAKQKQFKDQWVKVIDAFQVQLAKDDKTAQGFIQKNDVSSLIKITKQRVASTDAVLGQVLALYPPAELRKLQALSIYYMVTLIDRLQAQEDLAVAVLSNKATSDLQNNLNTLINRNNVIGNELAVELAKDGITLENPGQQPPGTSPSSAPTSSPSSTPGK